MRREVFSDIEKDGKLLGELWNNKKHLQFSFGGASSFAFVNN